MEFHRIIGKIDPDLIYKAQKALSSVFLELALRPDNTHVANNLGGDPLLFALLQPMQHVATLNIPTAATDGKRYYWNPKFVLKLSPIGLRLVCGHEAWHAIYMHPQRRGARIPELWNICVDYIVNSLLMDDIRFRKLDPCTVFTNNLGNFLTVEQYAGMLKNPFAPIKGLPSELIEDDVADEKAVALPKADDDRELTEEEKKELDRLGKKITFFYADPDLSADFKKPENLYDYFYKLLPKCPECGRVGMYKVPKDGEEYSKEKQEEEEKQNSSDKSTDGRGRPDCKTCGHDPSHSHGSGSGDGEGEDDGDEDGQGKPKYIDIFNRARTLDDHMDAGESPEKMGQRLADAIETARRMAGHIPAGLQEELGKLTAPIVKWKDVIRAQLHKSRDGHSRNDWTRFKTRQLFAGLLVPKRIDHLCKFVTLLDCSGSMSIPDIAFGVSQLQSLDSKAEGIVVPADCTIYWDKAVKLLNVSQEELKKINVVGRGGTMFADFFKQYEKKLGKADFCIMITDGYLLETDVADMVDPGIPVFWLITSTSSFKPPFGRAFYLRG